MTKIKGLLARVKLEPAVVGGVLTSIGALLAHVDSWKAALPVLISWIVRGAVTPTAAYDWTAPTITTDEVVAIIEDAVKAIRPLRAAPAPAQPYSVI